jgi:hypothetical protein
MMGALLPRSRCSSQACGLVARNGPFFFTPGCREGEPIWTGAAPLARGDQSSCNSLRVLHLLRRQNLRLGLKVLRSHADEAILGVLAGAGISLSGPSNLLLSRHLVGAATQAIESRLGVRRGILLDHKGDPIRLQPFPEDC